MGKYAALGDYLRAQHAREVPMSFAEIERITGAKLPRSAEKHRPWWSNNPNNSVMTRVWLDAGFRTEQVDMAGRRLVFRRVAAAEAADARKPASVAPSAPPGRPGKRRHPLFGALKGLVRIMPGTDLTKPADPDWGKRT